MKTQFCYLFEDTLAEGNLECARIAYVLKAARSRRLRNVERLPYGYRIKDVGMRLIKGHIEKTA